MKYIKDNIVYDEYRGILNADGKLVLGMTRAEILSLGYTPFLGNDLNDDGRTNDFCLRPYYIDFYSLYGETAALTQDVVLDTDLDDAITAYEDGRELVIRYWGELPEGSTDLKSVQESGEAKINAVYYFSSVEPGNLIFRSSFPVSMIDTARYTKSNYNCIALSTTTTPKVLHFLPSSDSYVSQVQVEELTEEEYVDLTKNAQGNFIVNSGSSSAEVADYVRYVESSSPNIIRIFRRVSSKDASEGGSMSTSGNSASYIFSEINETSNSINILVCTLGQGSIADGDWQLIENLYQKALVSGENIKTINNSSILGSGNVDLVPTETFNNFCPIIEDTRSSAVAAITGVAPFSTLVDGQRIIVHLKYASAQNATLQLTLNGGTTTENIPLIGQISTGLTRVWANQVKAGQYISCLYDATTTQWLCIGIDTNTIYASIMQSDVNTARTAEKLVTGKMLHDNAYIVEETYSSGSLKANKFYDFGTVSSLTIPSLDATNDLVSNALNFYALRFIAGADNISITFPTGVIVDDEPTINTGDYVEIMINLYVVNGVNNFYASIKVWQAQ